MKHPDYPTSRLPPDILRDLASTPVAQDIINSKLRELNEDELNLTTERIETLRLSKTKDHDHDLATTLVNDAYQANLAHIKKRRNKLRSLKPLTNPSHIPPDVIEQAKQFPLQDLISNPAHAHSRRLTALCPFHKESTPSFTVYIDTNSYYCFGCNAHGDSISYVQKIYNLSFREAIKFLTQ